MILVFLVLLVAVLVTTNILSFMKLRREQRGRRADAQNAGFFAHELEFQWKRAQRHVLELYEEAGRQDTPHWADPYYSPWE